MTPIAKKIADALLEHHATICVTHRDRPPEDEDIDRCLITYGDLCIAAGVPVLAHVAGKFLAEIAGWCSEHEWPPINSLAVNSTSRNPGGGYDNAAGCNLINWLTEVKCCIAFSGYPETV